MSPSTLDAVSALLPAIRERSDEIEAARRLPADLVDHLRQAGAFRMPMPAAWGGPELDYVEQALVVEALSTADPSVGWCVMIGSDAGFYSSFLDDAVGRELYPDLDMVTAGWVFPVGRATPVDGGYVVSGRWQFGSSCTFADVLVGGCLVVGPDGAPVLEGGAPVTRVVMAPAAEFEIIDTWVTTGLAGSGSNDYACADLFVPTDRTWWFTDPVRRPGTLYAHPGGFITNMVGVPLGLARRAIDEATAFVAEKVLVPGFTPMRDLPHARTTLGRAEATLAASRAYALDSLARAWAELEQRGQLSRERRAHLTLSRHHAVESARDVAIAMADLVGTASIRKPHVLDRLVRDAHVLRQHLASQDRMVELAGGMLLGAEPSLPIL